MFYREVLWTSFIGVSFYLPYVFDFGFWQQLFSKSPIINVFLTSVLLYKLLSFSMVFQNVDRKFEAIPIDCLELFSTWFFFVIERGIDRYLWLVAPTKFDSVFKIGVHSLAPPKYPLYPYAIALNNTFMIFIFRGSLQ